jgi:WD40 repeat protein
VLACAFRLLRFLLVALCLVSFTAPGSAQIEEIPVGAKEPILRLQAGGPTSYVTSLALSADGGTLYAAGWDKVIRIWQNKDGAWQEKPAFRVPLGPGVDGRVNALALSQDGNWLASAGTSVIRSRAPFDQRGIIISQWSSSVDRQDQGVIYVFDTRTRQGRILRGQEGPVWALMFVPSRAGAANDEPPMLVSAAQQFVDKTNSKVGALWLWDVAKGTHRDWSEALPDMERPELVGRPGLAVWRSLKQPERLQVASAWQDGVLRFWDIAEADGDAKEEKTADAKENIALLALPGQQRLLSGGFRANSSYLQGWKLPGRERIESLPPLQQLPAQTGYVPIAISSFARSASQDHAAAVVLAVKGTKQEFRLHILDLNPKSFGAMKADILLGDRGDRLPTLATAENGRFLAVAGHSGHEIRVYDIDDLFAKGNKAQPAKLGSVGTSFHYAAFVKGPAGTGLVLNKLARNVATLRNDDVVFDFSKPGLKSIKGWQPDTANHDGWDVKLGDKDAQGRARWADVTGNGKTTRIELPAGEGITAWALLTPRKPAVGESPVARVPILALASRQPSEMKLALYDAATGKKVRHLTGHDALIHCLAFSGDGRLLVSAGEDQSVCVWSLTDFDKVWDHHGQIAGVTVMERTKGSVQVANVATGSPAAAALQSGDVLEGVDKLEKFESALQFYLSAWEKKPGQKLAVKIKDKGAKELPVDQGIDERFPLVTLFITQAAKPEDCEWIAWHPQGPYVVSSEKAERYLGWHINTGNADKPAEFAGAAKYKDKYLKPNILKELIARGDLAAVAPQRPELPDPAVFVQIGDEMLDPIRADKEGRLRIQPRVNKLKVTVLDFPLNEISGMEWKLDDGKTERFAPRFGKEWCTDLPAAWKAGEHTVRVTVHVPEGRVPAYHKEFKVLYQPYQSPPPIVTTELDNGSTVKEPLFVLKAKIRAGSPNQQVDVRIFINEDKALPVAWPATSGELAIVKELQLRRGTNTVKIEAVNKNALKGSEAAETAVRIVRIDFDPQKPRIALEELVSIEDGKPNGVPLRLQPGDDKIDVEVPRIRVRGKVSATEKLAAVSRDEKSLAGFQVDGFAFDDEIAVTPGSNKLTYRASTKNAQETRTLEVFYRPPLPRILFEPPQGGLVYYDDGKGPPKVTLNFRMVQPSDPSSLKTLGGMIWINGKSVKLSEQDLKAAKLVYSFTPETRDSHVHVQLSNPWRPAASNSEVVHVEYLRVPYSLKFDESPPKSMEPVVNLRAHVKSALPLKPEWVDATVDGRKIGTIELIPGKEGNWTVLLKDVSLNAKVESVVVLRVGNEDGYSRRPAACKIAYAGKPPSRPGVTLLAPKRSTEPEIAVEISVRSEGPLHRLSLSREGDKRTQPIDVSKLKLAKGEELKLRLLLSSGDAPIVPVEAASLKKAPDGYLEGKVAIALQPGLNTLNIQAANEGGETSAQAAVDYFRDLPVSVIVDQLESDGQKPFQIHETEGQIKEQAPKGRVWLTGLVRWGSSKDDRLKAVRKIHVRVNGFLQVTEVALEPPTADQPRERRFRAPLFLTKSKDNIVQIDFPDLPLEDSTRREFRLDCAQPVPEKRFVHLLIVGVGEKDRDKLRQQVLSAMGAKALNQEEFELPTFDRGLVYGPLIDNFDPLRKDDILARLIQINMIVGRLSQEGPTNHVVLVYYKGGEEVNKTGHFLLLRGDEKLESGLLEDTLVNVEGAPVLLLDVLRGGGAPELSAQDTARLDRFANLSPEGPLAVMRLAKLGGRAVVPDPSLMMAWKEALSQQAQATRLSELERRINSWIQPLLKKNQGTMLYDRNIPPSLADLVIGQAR